MSDLLMARSGTPPGRWRGQTARDVSCAGRNSLARFSVAFRLASTRPAPPLKLSGKNIARWIDLARSLGMQDDRAPEEGPTPRSVHLFITRTLHTRCAPGPAHAVKATGAGPNLDRTVHPTTLVTPVNELFRGSERRRRWGWRRTVMCILDTPFERDLERAISMGVFGDRTGGQFIAVFP